VQNVERPNSQRYQRIQHGALFGKLVECFKRMTLVSKDQMADKVDCKALKALFEISYKIAETGENQERIVTFLAMKLRSQCYFVSRC
jgi:hypothetical protein